MEPAQPPRRRPGELTLVVGLLAATGALAAFAALRALPDFSRLMFPSGALADLADLSRALGALVGIFIAVVGYFAFACLAVAWMLWQADRAGRALAEILCAVFVLAVVAGDDHSGSLVAAAVVAAAVVAVLAFAPATRAWFTGPDARQRAEPVPLVVARLLAASASSLAVLVGVFYLLFGSVDGSYTAYGLLLLAGAMAGFVAVRAVKRRVGRAATYVAVVFGGYAVLLLVAAKGSVGGLLLAGIAAAVPLLLWLPESSRRYLGLGGLDGLADAGTPVAGLAMGTSAAAVPLSWRVRPSAGTPGAFGSRLEAAGGAAPAPSPVPQWPVDDLAGADAARPVDDLAGAAGGGPAGVGEGDEAAGGGVTVDSAEDAAVAGVADVAGLPAGAASSAGAASAVVARPPFVLEVSNGQRIALWPGRIVVGREPEADEPSTRRVVVEDRARLVSRTHLRFDVAPGGERLTVRDVGSANGSALVSPVDRVQQSLAAGTDVEIAAGWRVRFGNLEAQVVAGSAGV